VRIYANLRVQKQVLPVLDNRVSTGTRLYIHDVIPNIPKTTLARDSGDGVLHSVRSVDGGSHRNFDRVVGTVGERERKLQSLCRRASKYWGKCEYIGVFGAA
jgi:hypothetical protein